MKHIHISNHLHIHIHLYQILFISLFHMFSHYKWPFSDSKLQTSWPFRLSKAVITSRWPKTDSPQLRRLTFSEASMVWVWKPMFHTRTSPSMPPVTWEPENGRDIPGFYIGKNYGRSSCFNGWLNCLNSYMAMFKFANCEFIIGSCEIFRWDWLHSYYVQ